MIPTTLEEALLKQTQGLPEEAVRQVIDFAHFLRQKQTYLHDNVAVEITTMSEAQIAHLEKEFEDYQQLYPREDG